MLWCHAPIHKQFFVHTEGIQTTCTHIFICYPALHTLDIVSVLAVAPSRDTCSVAQCKFNSLPLFLFDHFSSGPLTHTHTCACTHAYRCTMLSAPVQLQKSHSWSIVIVVILGGDCTVSRKCYRFLHAVCIRRREEEGGNLCACVSVCVCACNGLALSQPCHVDS